MNRFLQLVLRRPVAALLVALGISAALHPGSRNVEVSASSEALLDEDSSSVQFYRQVSSVFGDDVLETIVIHGTEIFETPVLRAIESLTENAMGIDGVTRTVSLTTSSNLKGRDNVISTERLIPEIPQTQAELEHIRSDALSNPVLVGEVVSADGQAAAVHIFIESRPGDKEFSGRIVSDIEDLVDRERRRLGPEVQVFQVGSPSLKEAIGASLRKDGNRFGPYTAIVLLLCLGLFFRSSIAMLLPILTSYMSILGTAGFMGYMGMDKNPVTLTIPTMLLVIGSTEDMHLLSDYARGIGRGFSKSRALFRMTRKTGIAIFLTTLTTLAGFGTLTGNSIPILRDFGLAASFGLALNFLLTILLVPALLKLLPVPRHFHRPAEGTLKWPRRIIHGSFNHPQWPLVGTVIAIGLALWGFSQMRIDTSYSEFFRKDAEINQRFHQLADILGGGTNYYVVIDTGTPDGLFNPSTLREIDALSTYLKQNSDSTIGYTDFIRKLHLEMNNGDPAFDRIPDDRALIAQYTLLLDGDDLSRFVDFDYQTACILIRTSTEGSAATNRSVEGIYQFVRSSLSSKLDVHVTGESVLVAEASDEMALELVSNLGLMFAVIALIITFLTRSAIIGLVCVIPNAFPVLIVFGTMGFLGIPLSTATFPVAIISLGIAVDDTIHLLVRYSQAQKHFKDKVAAIHDTLSHEIRPVLTTSVALIAGFLVLTLGEFVSVYQFGLLSAVAIGAALLADLFITPPLLRICPWRPR